MIIDRFCLEGRKALVTGATRGIGLGVARALAEAGAHVALSSKTPRPETMRALEGDSLSVEYIQADMEDPAAPDRLMEAFLARNQRIDILVNNAGVADNCETEHFSDERWRRLMTINLDSVFRCCRAALPAMRRQQRGAIVNIGSISGYVSNVPQPQAAYNASKAAVHMFSKSLASDYALDGIRVNAIAPGYILTDMIQPGVDNPDICPTWVDMTPMRRFGKPEDIGAACVYLCSDAASFVTGSVLVIDGGYTSR